MDCFNCRQHTSLYSRQNGQVSTRRRRRVGDALEQKAFREVHHFQTTFETTFDDISSHLQEQTWFHAFAQIGSFGCVSHAKSHKDQSEALKVWGDFPNETLAGGDGGGQLTTQLGLSQAGYHLERHDSDWPKTDQSINIVPSPL